MIVYCYECDRRIDTDYDAEHFEFDDLDNPICLLEQEKEGFNHRKGESRNEKGETRHE